MTAYTYNPYEADTHDPLLNPPDLSPIDIWNTRAVSMPFAQTTNGHEWVLEGDVVIWEGNTGTGECVCILPLVDVAGEITLIPLGDLSSIRRDPYNILYANRALCLATRLVAGAVSLEIHNLDTEEITSVGLTNEYETFERIWYEGVGIPDFNLLQLLKTVQNMHVLTFAQESLHYRNTHPVEKMLRNIAHYPAQIALVMLMLLVLYFTTPRQRDEAEATGQAPTAYTGEDPGQDTAKGKAPTITEGKNHNSVNPERAIQSWSTIAPRQSVDWEAPVLNQNDSRWAAIPQGFNGADGTIGRYGCLLTALAMAIDAADHQDRSGGQLDNPAKVNTALQERGGFSHAGFFNPNTGFSALGISTLYDSGFGFMNADSTEKMKQALTAGLVVIARKSYNDASYNSNLDHYVLVTGYDEGKGVVIIHDPYYGTVREIPWSTYWQSFYGIRVLNITFQNEWNS